MKQNIKKIVILSVISVIAVIFSRCQNDEYFLKNDDTNLASAKTWFSKYEGNGDNIELFQNLNYEWQKAEIKEGKDGTQLIVVPIVEVKKEQNEDWEQRLYIYKIDQNNYKALLYEFYPENLAYANSNDFNGYISVWDLKTGFIKAAKLVNDKIVENGDIEILSKDKLAVKHTTAKVPQESNFDDDTSVTVGGIQLRTVVVQNNHIDSMYYVSRRGEDYMGGSSADYTAGYGGGGGGANGSSNVTTFNIIASGPKIDPKKENKCFDLTKSAELTIYVQQGKEGTRELIGPNEVGHVFIGIKQSDMERYYGFYPESGANSVLVGVGVNYVSELRDNSKELYHVSISKSITGDQLAAIVKYANNPPTTYNVNSYACTDFGIAVGKLGGINLPSTKASAITFNGTSPGNLGEDIKSGNFPSTTKITTKSNAPARKGDCK